MLPRPLNSLPLPKLIMSREILIDACRTAFFVGIILNLINNSSAYSHDENISGYSILLNFAVPFLVSAYSGARAAYMSDSKNMEK